MKTYVTLQLRMDPGTPGYIKAAALKAGDSMNRWCESRLIAAAQAELGGEGGPPPEPEEEPEPQAGGGKRGRTAPVIPDAARRFAEDFRASMEAAHPGWKAPTPGAFVGWQTEARKLLQERGEEDARDLAQWLFQGESEGAVFWRACVLSVTKFRQKYDQMQAKRRVNGHRGRSPVELAVQNILRDSHGANR